MSAAADKGPVFPRYYAGSQVAIHWAIALLILCQYLFAEEMEEAWRAWRRGGDAALPETPLGATMHAVFGIMILVLAVARVGLRLKNGAPPLPKSHPAIVRFAAYGTHLALYAFLFLMPISGAAAWSGGIGAAAGFHVAAKNVLLAFVALHVLGAVAELAVFHHRAAKQMATLGIAR